jgi:chorismate dehydratase
MEFLFAKTPRAGLSGVCCQGDADELPVPGFPSVFVYDVAYQWREMTGKPCVLAIWAGHRDKMTPEVVADFQASKEFGLAHIEDIAQAASVKLDLPASSLESYLRDNIDFSLDEENLEGLKLYFEKCAAAGLIPRARPVEFATAPAGSVAGSGA